MDSNSNKLAKYSKSGTSYTCTAVTEPGYYRGSSNFMKVIKCDSSGCSDDAEVATTTCVTNNNGKIIGTDYNAVVCIDGSTGTVQRFSGTEIKDHALGGTGSAFGTEKYYEINVTKDSIVLDKSGGSKYLFYFF